MYFRLRTCHWCSRIHVPISCNISLASLPFHFPITFKFPTKSGFIVRHLHTSTMWGLEGPHQDHRKVRRRRTSGGTSRGICASAATIAISWGKPILLGCKKVSSRTRRRTSPSHGRAIQFDVPWAFISDATNMSSQRSFRKQWPSISFKSISFLHLSVRTMNPFKTSIHLT